MQLVPYSPEGYKLLHDGMLAFSEMQQNGIRMDVQHIKQSYKQLSKRVKKITATLDMFKEVQLWKKKYKDKFTLDSDEQLSDILFKEMGYESVVTTDKGNASVNQEALSALELPFTNELLQYRKYTKIKDTFLKGLLDEQQGGYLHPFINLHTARTYRSSSSMPNIQNQPTRDPEAGEIIRKSFISRENHYLVCADYGGAEVKAACLYHKDPTMIGYLQDPLHADMHADFACLLFKLKELDGKNSGQKTLRKGTKNAFTFPQFYGDYYGNNAIGLWKWMGLHGEKLKKNQGVVIDEAGTTIAEHLIKNKIKTLTQFTNHVKRIEDNMWNKRFPVYKAWKESQYNFYLKNGYVQILSGFICQGMMDRNAVINYPIQGLSFHFLLWSCVQLIKKMKKMKMQSKVIFQVHDEVVADVVKEEKDDFLGLLKQTMIHDLKDHWEFIFLPLELEVDCSELNGNWFNKKTILHYIN